MSLTPYDWNQSIQTRSEYIEERLRDGSPVIAFSTPEGVLMLTIHQTQRKVFEIYDRLIFGGIGNQADVETMRNSAIDFAHREGFTRSPDDVTAQRLVGSVLSPALKRAFGDPFTAPFVFRGLFAELGVRQDHDLFYTLGFDGEYRKVGGAAVVAGTALAETKCTEFLTTALTQASDRDSALKVGLEAWAQARLGTQRPSDGRHGFRSEEDEEIEILSETKILQDALKAGTLEIGLLDRSTSRHSKFRLLSDAELQPLLNSLL